MAAKNRHNHIDCLGSALPDEEYFVLLARDPAMPALLGIWSSLRVGNVQAATENFMRLMAPDLVQHYQTYPDIAKSQEAVDTANRAADWREANLDGPDGKPSWKQSLVRPQMLGVKAAGKSDAAVYLTSKIAIGLRQVTAEMAKAVETHEKHGDDYVGHHRDVAEWTDRVNGYAAELEGGSNG